MSGTSRALLGIAGAALVPILSACGAGADAVTNRPYAPADGVQTVVADRLKVINALVVATEKGEQPAVLSMALVDLMGEGDELTGITVGDGTPVRLSGETRVPPRGTLLIGGAGAPASAVIPDFPGRPGQTVPVRLEFATAGDVTINTVVYPRAGAYETVTPGAGAGGGATSAPEPTLSVAPDSTEPAEGRNEGEEPTSEETHAEGDD